MRILFIGKSTLFQVALQYRLDARSNLFVPKITKNALVALKRDFLLQILFLNDAYSSGVLLLKNRIKNCSEVSESPDGQLYQP